jgi:dipeptidyl aminopeptidase/acylaminoacyl peptidase
MGGYLTLHAMVITRDIRAGVVWAGMVVSPADLLERWRTPTPGPSPTPPPDGTPGPGRRGWRELLEQYGQPADNPEFWAAISANNYLADLSGPLQLHHSTTDETVPYWFSESLNEELTAAGQYVEFYTYEGDNHNLSASFGSAMARSVEFFDEYVKGAVASP